MLITPVAGEILVLSMIIITSLRVFFIKETRLDSVVLFAPLAFIISILTIIGWGLNLNELILFYFTLVFFICNYRGFVRFCQHLYVDTYSPVFFVTSCILIVTAVAISVIFFIFSPAYLDESKYPVTIEKSFYYKNDSNQFVQATDIFDKKQMKLTVCYPSAENRKKEKDAVILLIHDKRSGSLAYQPYCILLANAGYTVYAADFKFSTMTNQDSLWAGFWYQAQLNRDSRRNPEKYFAENPVYKNTAAQEYEILSQIADKNEAHIKKFIAVGDGIPAQSFDLIKNPARKIDGTFSLDSISDYKTSGYGFIQQTEPLFSKIRFNLSKDKIYFIPGYAVMKTNSAIEALQ